MLHKNAFTLIELLIVLIIIGVLATLAVPQFTGYVEKSRAAEALNMLAALRTGEDAYKLANGSYTTDFTKLGISNVKTNDPDAVAAGQHWWYSIMLDTATRYAILAYRSSKNAGSAKDQTIIMWFDEAAGVSWKGNHPGLPKQ
jgi:prepilin-type N-terminal cleavage/methylation domain-containing protein